MRRQSFRETQVSDRDDAAFRRAWTVPPASGIYQEIDLALLDPADPDDRHLLILAEHPELDDAMQREAEEVEVGGLVFNPRMHIAIHEVVANQLWDNDPPEVWETARRLEAAGYERHEILHMLMSTVTEELWHVLRAGRAYDPQRHRAALRALPDSWERQRH
jgi:hypothetical protein